MKRVVIVGMGFAGLSAARLLRDQPVELILVDRQNYHLFTPLLYQVATGSIEEEAIVYPIRAIVRDWNNTTFRLSEVYGFDLDTKRIFTRSGDLAYDYLILAPGSVTSFFGMGSVEAHAYSLKYLTDGARVRNQILSAFELAVQEKDDLARGALLTFVIVGGGPTGVEFAGALAELVDLELRKDHPELENEAVRIVLLEALDRLLPPFPGPLGDYTQQRLESMGVDVRLGARVVDAGPDSVVLEGGERIPCRTLFWAAGVQAEPVAQALPVDKAPRGMVPVGPHLNPPDYEHVYVVGDAAYVEQEGQPLPQMAPVAVQEGEYAARAILASLSGERIQPFRYQDRGVMAVIGRGKAVARLFGRNFKGFLAWLVWLVFHLIMLIGFRNRLVVMINWAADYIFFERKLRLITRPTQVTPVQSGSTQEGA